MNTQQTDYLEDTILDNYVALLRHALGDEKLKVISDEGRLRWVDSNKRKASTYKPKLGSCVDCGHEFMKRAPHNRFCGTIKEKTGCAYKRYKERQRMYWCSFASMGKKNFSKGWVKHNNEKTN